MVRCPATYPYVLPEGISDRTWIRREKRQHGFQVQPCPVFDRDHVWAGTRDEHDVQFVARYEIEWNDG
jgi:hypothetical protein